MIPKPLSLFKSNRGVTIVFFSPFAIIIFLFFMIIVLINKVIELDPKGLWDYYLSAYLSLFGPILLGYVVTPVIWKDIQKKTLKVVVICVRVLVPIIIYILLHGSIINYILDIPSALTGNPETIEGVIKVDPPRQVDLKYDLHTTKFLIGFKHFDVDSRDYTINDSGSYEVLYLKHSNTFLTLLKCKKIKIK